MITNYERIKNMTVEEMVELFDSQNFIYVVVLLSKEKIKQWLESESE